MGRKTITVSESTFQALDEQRDGRVWDAFLSQLLEESTTEPKREVVEARLTDAQYTELFGQMEAVKREIEGARQP